MQPSSLPAFFDSVLQLIIRTSTDLPPDVAAALVGSPNYPELFRLAFGDPTITSARIAMAIATNPTLLLLDEPMAGMGPEESERMTTLLKGLAQEHAILLIEHDMDFVFAVADWMTVMAEGTVIAEGKPETIRANTAVQDAYLGGHA